MQDVVQCLVLCLLLIKDLGIAKFNSYRITLVKSQLVRVEVEAFLGETS